MEKNITKLGKKVSTNQKELWVTFLEQNLDLARGRFESVDGNKDMRNKWNEVAELLNAAGGAHKDGEKWKRTWTDLRLYVKNRASELKTIANRSGVNGFNRQKTLSNIEERIVNIMSWNSVVGDQNAAPESGLPKNLAHMNTCPHPSTSTTSNVVEIVIEPQISQEYNDSPVINATISAPTPSPTIISRVQTTEASTLLTTRRRKRSLEDIMEESLIEEKKRNKLLEKQIEVDLQKVEVERSKVTALNKIAEAISNQNRINNNSNNNNSNNLFLNEEYLET